ncbi:MAG: hypothetical protein IJ567_10230 [Lachnospiraceae bacterium]|nr:hypothetical protein [Lachnospiraceae bacterium]
MKMIFREYGKTAAAVLLVSALISLIWIMLTQRGEREQSLDNRNFSVYQDAWTARQIYSRKAPEISWQQGKELKLGSGETLESFFEAVDQEGTPLAVEILSITDDSGEPCTYPFQQDGIYRIVLRALDRMGKRAVVSIDVPVNGR